MEFNESQEVSLTLEKNIYAGKYYYPTNEARRPRFLSCKVSEKFEIDDEMRPRTSSMPTKSNYCKPSLNRFRRSHLGINFDPDLDVETYKVRAFEMNDKGYIVKRSESLLSRSTNSVYSSEGEMYPLTYSSVTSSTRSQESITFPVPLIPLKVLLSGSTAVGKTALAQQFMTSEYLGGFNTSCDGDAEKTVNVLLNGEETSLAFVEQAENDELEDDHENIAAYLIVYACDDRKSFDRAVDTLYNLRQKQHNEDVIFFVGNKSDLVRSRCVSAEEAKAVAVTYGCKFVETSVVLNVNVDELLVGIVKQLRLRSAENSNDKSTGCASSSKSLLNKIFKKEKLSKSCENLYA